MSVTQLNLDLCRALGVKDPEQASAVTLEIRPGQMPRVIVERVLKTADGLQTAAAQLRLKADAE